MAKKQASRNVNASFRVTLDVGMDMGNMSLEDAMAKARALKAGDIVGLDGLDHNDSSVEVYSLYQNEA